MGRDIVRREKDMEALIWIEMMERENWQRSDRKGRPVVLYLLCLDLINYVKSIIILLSCENQNSKMSDIPAGFQKETFFLTVWKLRFKVGGVISALWGSYSH